MMYHFLVKLGSMLSVIGLAMPVGNHLEPSVTFDATAFGWKLQESNNSRFEYEWGIVSHHTVVFDRSDKLYVGFTVHNTPESLTSRSMQGLLNAPLPYKFRVLGIDSQSGKLRENLTFESGNQRRNSLYACGNNLVVNANDSLRDVGGDEHQALQFPHDPKGGYNIIDDASRQHLLVMLRSQSSPSTLLLDCPSLKAAVQCSLGPLNAEAWTFINSSTIIEQRDQVNRTSLLLKADHCEAPYPLMTVPQPVTMRALSASQVLLLSSKTVWVQSALMSRKLVEYTLGKDQSFDPYSERISEDGHYAAIPVFQQKKRGFFDQTFPIKSVSIAICNLQSQQVQTIAVPNSLLDSHSDFDINRDGSRVAIFTSGVLQVFAISRQ